MTIALARKYRPTSFDDLVGQESVAKTLSQALDQDRLSHAYLFSGLRGSGKTSTARIFAKALLCDEGVSARPCEVCPQCVGANASKHMDIVEMDAASNRKIDDIRELIEHTKYKPSMARYKVFIIDEVHMLTKEAFNAILKTLEEPPDFVKFILATTDPLKIPATILSRSQHFRFKKIAQPLVLGHLENILNKEGVAFEKEAIQIIARSGAGSLRDSLTLLDQAIVYSSANITKEVVTTMLGIIDPTHLHNILQKIMQKDSDAVIAFIKEFNEYETQMILDEMTIFLKEKLLSQDREFSPMIIERLFRVITQSKELLNLGSDEEFVLSLTLFKMIEAVSIKDIDSMIEEIEMHVQPSAVSKGAKQAQEEPITQVASPDAQPQNAQVQDVQKEPESAASVQSPPKDRFKQLVEEIYDKDYELGKCFEENIEFLNFDGQTLQWSSHAQGECKALLGQFYSNIKTFVAAIYGREVVIQNIPPKPKDDTSSGSSCMEKNSALSDTQASQELDPKQIVNEPMVQKAAQLFKPEKIKIQSKI
ncbi:MAG: DNA polymerase III subunit gamma/tau [Campylobacterota bacterium]